MVLFADERAAAPPVFIGNYQPMAGALKTAKSRRATDPASTPEGTTSEEPRNASVTRIHDQQETTLAGTGKPGDWGGGNWRDGARFFADQMDTRALEHIRDKPRTVLGPKRT